MIRKLATPLLLVTWTLVARAEEPDEIPDPSVMEEFRPIVVGGANELFTGALVEAKVKGMIKRMGDSIIMAPPVQEVVVHGQGGGAGAGPVEVNICSPSVSASFRNLTNICMTNGVVVHSER